MAWQWQSHDQQCQELHWIREAMIREGLAERCTATAKKGADAHRKEVAKAGKAGYPGGKACVAIKAYKQAIDGLIFVEPRCIPYNLHGLKMDYCERILRANTPMGERTSIAKSESVPEGSTIEFSVVCLDPALEKMVKECLDYGKFRGLGQWRNSGKGRFVWDLLDANGAVIGGNNEFEE